MRVILSTLATVIAASEIASETFVAPTPVDAAEIVEDAERDLVLFPSTNFSSQVLNTNTRASTTVGAIPGTFIPTVNSSFDVSNSRLGTNAGVSVGHGYVNSHVNNLHSGVSVGHGSVNSHVGNLNSGVSIGRGSVNSHINIPHVGGARTNVRLPTPNIFVNNRPRRLNNFPVPVKSTTIVHEESSSEDHHFVKPSVYPAVSVAPVKSNVYPTVSAIPIVHEESSSEDHHFVKPSVYPAVSVAPVKSNVVYPTVSAIPIVQTTTVAHLEESSSEHHIKSRAVYSAVSGPAHGSLKPLKGYAKKQWIKRMKAVVAAAEESSESSDSSESSEDGVLVKQPRVITSTVTHKSGPRIRDSKSSKRTRKIMALRMKRAQRKAAKAARKNPSNIQIAPRKDTNVAWVPVPEKQAPQVEIFESVPSVKPYVKPIQRDLSAVSYLNTEVDSHPIFDVLPVEDETEYIFVDLDDFEDSEDVEPTTNTTIAISTEANEASQLDAYELDGAADASAEQAGDAAEIAEDSRV